MTDETPDRPDGDALRRRLELVDGMPLADRAEVYGTLHDELRRVLEGDDADAAS